MKMHSALLVVALFALMALSLAGCGGDGAGLSGVTSQINAAPTEVPEAVPLTVAQMTQGMNCVAKDFTLMSKDLPADVDTLSAEKGGDPTVTIHAPRLLNGTHSQLLGAYAGRKFIGPSGYFGFAAIDRIVAGITGKGGVMWSYRVVNEFGQVMPQIVVGAWDLRTPGFYTIRASAPGVPAYVFRLQIVGKGSGNVVMRAVAINPNSGGEYIQDATGRYQMRIGDKVFLVPTWYNFVSGKKVAAPRMSLVASAYLDQPTNVMIATGGQAYIVTGPGTVAASLSVYPPYTDGVGVTGKGGGGGTYYYWYARVAFIVGKG
ncbi:MAG: hypothetical protein WCG99_04020 [Candidatus Berkelbacteria bacterium]